MTEQSIGSLAAGITNKLAEQTGRVRQFPQESEMSAAQQIVPRDEQVPTELPESAAILNVIERAARDPNVDIDKMERLMAMRERVVAQTAKRAYLEALSKLQPKLPVIDRRGKITIRDKNDETKVRQSTPYALWEDINEAIRDVLAEHGFSLSFRTGLTAEGKITVTGILGHAEGHSEETTMTLPHDATGSKNAVQAVGSSTSYGKRYVAMALLNLTSRGEDDDAKAGGAEATITDDQLKELQKLAADVGADIPKFCKYLKVDALPDIPAKDFDRALAALEAKRVKA